MTRRIFEVDPWLADERVAVSRGTLVGGVEVIVLAGFINLATVIRTAAYRGGFDQRTNGRLRHSV